MIFCKSVVQIQIETKYNSIHWTIFSLNVLVLNVLVSFKYFRTTNKSYLALFRLLSVPFLFLRKSQSKTGLPVFLHDWNICHLYIYTRSLGALRAPTSSWRPFGPLNYVLRALRALRPCEPAGAEILSRTYERTNEQGDSRSWIFVTNVCDICDKYEEWVAIHQHKYTS